MEGVESHLCTRLSKALGRNRPDSLTRTSQTCIVLGIEKLLEFLARFLGFFSGESLIFRDEGAQIFLGFHADRSEVHRWIELARHDAILVFLSIFRLIFPPLHSGFRVRRLFDNFGARVGF